MFNSRGGTQTLNLTDARMFSGWIVVCFWNVHTEFNYLMEKCFNPVPLLSAVATTLYYNGGDMGDRYLSNIPKRN